MSKLTKIILEMVFWTMAGLASLSVASYFAEKTAGPSGESEKPLTEADIRRIVREEIEKGEKG